MGRLEGKRAIITGAARGLGRAIALKFAEEGARLLLVDIAGLEETRKMIEAKGAIVFTERIDVSNEADTQRMAEMAIKNLGGIDILVNNAAVGIYRKPFYELSSEEWDRVMAVNVKGYWLCAKAVFPCLKDQKKGKIINIASNTFFTGSTTFAHYAASKGGVIGLTRALARDLGDFNICVNAVAPGFLANEVGLALIGGDVSKYDVKQMCIKRVGTVDDVVGAVTFLASDESDFITGQVIVVDGGRVMH